MLQHSKKNKKFGLLKIIIFFQDTQLVIDKNKTGFQPPGDIPFEDLAAGSDSHSNGSKTSTPVSRGKHDNNTSAQRQKKAKGGIFSLFSSSKVRKIQKVLCKVCLRNKYKQGWDFMVTSGNIFWCM